METRDSSREQDHTAAVVRADAGWVINPSSPFRGKNKDQTERLKQRRQIEGKSVRLSEARQYMGFDQKGNLAVPTR